MHATPATKTIWLAFTIFAAATLRAAPIAPGSPARPTIPALLLIEPRDSSPLDAQIRTSQQRIKTTALPGAELERLGWLMIAKARASSDPGYYTLAGIAADALERDFSLLNEAFLLRGHVLQTRHRFAEAEALGRKLVATRGSAGDFALLGDALFDQGKIGDAAEAYQRMVDLKPGLDSYTRAANIRWIKGDVAGAIELQTLAVRAGGPGDPGALAWSLVRLGQLVWQQGDALSATALAARALEYVPDFAPALLLQGRLLLASDHAADALAPLARAAHVLPLPEPRWVYAEALRASGKSAEAVVVEEKMVREGIAEDPRTVALFLAMRRRDLATAVRLTTAELKNRSDVMTHAATALAYAEAGQLENAQAQTKAALGEGTVDARLLLVTGRVAALARQPGAEALLKRAQQLSPLLLPSERRLLDDSFLLLPGFGSAANPNEVTHQKSS